MVDDSVDAAIDDLADVFGDMTALRFASGVMATIVALVAVPLILVSAGLSSLSDEGNATLPTVGVATSSRALTVGDNEFDWTTRAFGDDPTIDVDPNHGSWSAVVMNIDGTPGVDADLTVSLPSGPVRVVSATLLGAGLMAAIASVLLFVVAFRRPAQFDGPEPRESTRDPVSV